MEDRLFTRWSDLDASAPVQTGRVQLRTSYRAGGLSSSARALSVDLARHGRVIHVSCDPREWEIARLRAQCDPERLARIVLVDHDVDAITTTASELEAPGELVSVVVDDLAQLRVHVLDLVKAVLTPARALVLFTHAGRPLDPAREHPSSREVPSVLVQCVDSVVTIGIKDTRSGIRGIQNVLLSRSGAVPPHPFVRRLEASGPGLRWL